MKYTVASIHRKPAKRGCDFCRQPSHRFFVSSFELYARLPQQRECAKDGLARSSKFGPVVEAVKGIALDCDSPCSFGGNNFRVESQCPFRKHIPADRGNFAFALNSSVPF